MINLKAYLTLTAGVNTAVAQFDPAFAGSHGCTDELPATFCQTLTSQGLTYEASQRVHVNGPIYQVAENVSTNLKAGSILAVERVTDLTNYTVPSGLTLSRFHYITTNLNGTIIPASAYILWPYTSYIPTARGRTQSRVPFVAWAHGTSGAGGQCAPSNYQNLQYNFVLPYPLALAGFAVVAPDYAGLGVNQWRNGTKIPHAWLSSPSQASDLANAVIAARTAFPELIKDFVAMGHSQGGAAAIAFAERQARTPVPGYLGTVAFAPAGRLINRVVDTPSDSNDTFTLNLLPRIFDGITNDYPAYNYSGFSDAGLKRWQIAMKYSACLPTETLLFTTPPEFIKQISKPGWGQTR